jgi:hypothetical protein
MLQRFEHPTPIAEAMSAWRLQSLAQVSTLFLWTTNLLSVPNCATHLTMSSM